MTSVVGVHLYKTLTVDFSSNWASEASPTHIHVCLSCPKMRRRNYVRACSKSVLGGKN